jgi:ketosteroid isomerase-like protein
VEEESSKTSRVMELYDAWNAGDRDSLYAAVTDDAEIKTLRVQLEGGSYIGPEGLRKALADWDEDWEYVRFTPHEIHEHDPFVVVETRVETKGKTSGVDLDVPVTMLWEFRGDRVSRVESFSEREDALRAAGIDD